MAAEQNGGGVPPGANNNRDVLAKLKGVTRVRGAGSGHNSKKAKVAPTSPPTPAPTTKAPVYYYTPAPTTKKPVPGTTGLFGW